MQQSIYFHSINFDQEVYVQPALGWTTQTYGFSKALTAEEGEAKIRDHYIAKYGINPVKIETTRARNQKESSYITIIH